MSKQCVIRQVLGDEVDPDEIPLASLQASVVGLMTRYMQSPSESLARLVVRMLGVIASHREAAQAPTGAEPYRRSECAWRMMLAESAALSRQAEGAPALH